MWLRFLTWLREAIDKMITSNSIKQALNMPLAISDAMLLKIEEWSKAYLKQSDWLSEEQVISMNLPASIASEIARLTTLEMTIEVTGDNERAKYINAQVKNLIKELKQQQVEYAVAKGGMIFKPYVKNAELFIDYVQADSFIPLRWDRNMLVACAFISQKQVNQYYYTRIETHQMLGNDPSGNKNLYNVKNAVYRSSDSTTIGTLASLTDVEDWSNIAPDVTMRNIKKPLYAFYRYPAANTVDTTSPLGISCYEKALETIKEADKMFGNFLWEFESATRALYVDELAFGRGEDGKLRLPKSRLYRTLKTTTQIGKAELFEGWSPDIRVEQFVKGIQNVLQRIEDQCGLAPGTLSKPDEIERTATEINARKQRTFALVSDNQQALQGACDDLFFAMDQLINLYNLAPSGKYETTYKFDDSIINNKEQQFTQDLLVIDRGVMSKIEFRMRNYGETEEVAKQKLEMANAERKATEMFTDTEE